MKKKRIVIALGHEALGSTLPEQQKAAARTAKAVADFIREDYQVVITHSNGPQVGMIHTAMNEFCRLYPEYTATPTSVCSAMSQGYIGYDLQNAIRTELLNRGIYKTVSTVLTQVIVDPYDEAFYHPTKVIGRVMTKEEAEEEEKKGNHVVEVADGFRRVVAAPKPMDIVEIDAISALSDADQVVIACGGGGIPVLAHPLLYKFSDDALDRCVLELKSLGIKALEVYYSRNLSTDTLRMKALADKYGLYYSGGSDFHGTYKPDIDIGTGTGSLVVPYELLDRLKDLVSH